MTENRLEKPSLAQVQEWMSRAIADSGKADSELLAWICADEYATAEERLSVYSSAYLHRVVEVLQSDFKAVHSVLALSGEERFVEMTAQYLKAYPSKYQNIGEIGRSLPECLKSYSVTLEFAFLPELAFLEWAMNESFLADDREPFDFSKVESFSEEDWNRARFSLDSSVRLIQSNWPVYEIWKNTDVAQYPTEAAKEFLLLHRDVDGEVQVDLISRGCFEVLQKIQEGMTLGTLCRSVEGERVPVKEDEIQNWFQEWIQKRVIQEIVII